MFEIIVTLALAAADAAPAPLPAVCEPGEWKLGGAHYRVREEATFKKSWLPALERVAGCLADSAMEKACVRVRGQYDERAFGMTVVSAYGSTKAAQTARALGRSGRVVEKLLELDVPTHKIDERPPADQPSFRGVHIQLFADCLASAVPHIKKEATKQLVQQEVEKLLAARTPAVDRAELQSAIAAEVAKLTEDLQATSTAGSVAEVHHLWLMTAVELGVAGSAPGFSSALHLGLGWNWHYLSAQLDMGLAAATPKRQQLGIEVNAAVGAKGWPWSWMWLGGVFGYRVSSVSPASPWLERGWYTGVQAAQRLVELYDGGSVHLMETVALGQAQRRGTVIDGTIFRVVPRNELLMRFGLALAVRHTFF